MLEDVRELLAQEAVPNSDAVTPWVTLSEPVIIELLRAIMPFLATNSFGIILVS
jgi:hypothetical protein